MLPRNRLGKAANNDGQQWIAAFVLCTIALCAVIALAGLAISRAIDRQTRKLQRNPP
jgi:hypothetical protein